MNKFFVVLDLEFAKVNRTLKKIYGLGTEIIQIGALLLDESYEIIDQFSTYISPKYGKLDSSIKDLTGITVENLAKAPDFCTALKKMSEWLPDHSEIEFVSWSDNDQRQLEHELAFNHYSDLKFNSPWIDCQKMFGIFMGEPKRKYGLQYVLCIADIEGYDDHEHNAFSDAYNTALIFSKLEKGTLRLNKHYKKENPKNEKDILSCTLGDRFQEIMLGWT